MMKNFVLASAALALLGICGAASAQTDGKNGGIRTAPPPSATRPTTANIDRNFLIGYWTDDGNCDNAVEFREDGSFLTTNNATGVWIFDGWRLALVGESSVILLVEAVGRDRISVVNQDGSIGGSTRCPDTTRPRAGSL